jgi:hypothetical protein
MAAGYRMIVLMDDKVVSLIMLVALVQVYVVGD